VTKTDRIFSADDPLTELLAEIWHEEEVRAANGSAPRNPWTLATDGEKERARERVDLMLVGEVKWSETTPGDRAIWNGRQRGHHAWVRSRTPLRKHLAQQAVRHSLDFSGVNETVSWHLYDTLEVSAETDTRTYRLFGNRNIGNSRLTNLWIPGQTGSEQVIFVSDMFVTLRGVYSEIVRTEALRYLENATAYLSIGEKRCSPEVHLVDLLVDRRPVDMIIPERQTYMVTVQPFRRVTTSETAFDVVFHLDGGMNRPLH
jgi:hypothetical protein